MRKSKKRLFADLKLSDNNSLYSVQKQQIIDSSNTT